mgnify:CR=1 FL=1
MKSRYRYLLGLSSLLACAFVRVTVAAEKADSEMNSMQVEATVDMSRTHQTLCGFGACFFMHDIADYCDAGFYDDLVFDLGVTMVRYPMPLSFARPDPDNPLPMEMNMAVHGIENCRFEDLGRRRECKEGSGPEVGYKQFLTKGTS